MSNSNVVDQKRVFNKLKHDLESWRDLILIVNSILKWDKKFFPAIIFGVITTTHLILWYLDLSALTLISLAALLAVIADYIYPIVSRFVFKPDNWTGEQETKFEEVCNDLCTTKLKLCSSYEFFFKAKEQRSTMFVIAVTITLLVFAWIGTIVDNLLLSYLAILALSLYPGLHKHGFIGSVKSQFGSVISSKIKQLKKNSTKTD